MDEGGDLVFTVTLSADVQGGVNVAYATADGTAKLTDNDYTSASGTLSFTGTANEQLTITVATTEDTKVELAETLTVTLSGISAAERDERGRVRRRGRSPTTTRR